MVINPYVQWLLLIFGSGSVIYVIGKLALQKVFEGGLDLFRLSLSKELESHKADLKRWELEHQIRFSKLHEKQGDLMTELYSKLYDLQKMLEGSFNEIQGSDSERYKYLAMFSESFLSDMKEIIRRNAIFFSESICEKVEAIIQHTDNAIRTGRGIKEDIDKAGKWENDSWDRLIRLMLEVARDIPLAKVALEIEFRNLLRVEVRATNASALNKKAP
jgi:hypothetical protein